MAEQQAPTWADPTPAALFGLGAGTTAVWALLTHRVGMQDLHIVIVWFAAAALLLAIAGLIALRRGDPVGGGLNLAFGILFFGTPTITYCMLLWGGMPLAALGITAIPGLTVNGWVFLLLGIILCAFIPIMARQSWLFMVALLVFAVAIFMLALFNLQSMAAQAINPWYMVGVISGWLIGLAGLAMVYLGMAMALLFGLGRMVLPIPGPLGGGGASQGG